jgi:hypothetical protein
VLDDHVLHLLIALLTNCLLFIYVWRKFGCFANFHHRPLFLKSFGRNLNKKTPDVTFLLASFLNANGAFMKNNSNMKKKIKIRKNGMNSDKAAFNEFYFFWLHNEYFL